MSIRLIQSLWRDCEGSEFIEASILLPVMLVLFYGVFEFSWYFYNQQLAMTGVRDAARYLARASTSETTNPCTDSSLVRNAQNLAATGTISNGGGPRVKGWTYQGVSITCPAYTNNVGTIYQGGATIYLITVSTNFADPALGLLRSLGIIGTLGISVSHSERHIGPG